MTCKTKLFSLISASFYNQTLMVQSSDQPEDFSSALNAYIFFSYCILSSLQANSSPDSAAGTATSKSKASVSTKEDWYSQKKAVLSNFQFLLTITDPMFIKRIWSSTSKLEYIFGIFVKCILLILEDGPEMSKCPTFPSQLFDFAGCLCKSAVAFQLQHPLDTLKAGVIQLLKMNEQLGSVLSDFVSHVCLPPYEYVILLEGVLKEFAGTEMPGNDMARRFSSFLVPISKKLPKLLLKNFSYLSHFIAHEPYLLRNTMLEVICNIIQFQSLANSGEAETTRKQITILFRTIEERSRDNNSFVRSRVLMVCSKLCQANAIPLSRRAHVVDMAVDRLLDKSSGVRKRAILLLSELLAYHPFSIDGGELSLELLQEKRSSVVDSLSTTDLDQKITALGDVDLGWDSDDETEGAPKLSDNPEWNALMLKKKYYSDAIIFVKQLEKAVPIVLQLLASKVKSEVLEAINFFVLADLYNVNSAKLGIRKILHLIWAKETSNNIADDEDPVVNASSIKDAVLLALKKVYLDSVSPKLSHSDRIQSMVFNLVSILSPSHEKASFTLSDLVSFTEVVHLWQQKKMISTDLTKMVWNLFAHCSSEPLYTQRAYATLVEVFSKHNDDKQHGEVMVLKSNFLLFGLSDPYIAKCILRTLNYYDLSSDGHDDEAFLLSLFKLTSEEWSSEPWFEVITVALNLIFEKMQHPDRILASLVQLLAAPIFSSHYKVKAIDLAKLFHVLGQGAVKHACFIDKAGVAMKKELHMNSASSSDKSPHNFAQMASSAASEEQITEYVSNFKNKELLYSSSFCFSKFLPLLLNVCQYPEKYPSEAIQNYSLNCLVKFMTISNPFCSSYLGLFLTILTNTRFSVIRSNCVIAFGDLVAAHANLMDQNMHFLFDRLQDNDYNVKKNAFMVSMHLVLNGLIKVKGQISDMSKCLLGTDSRISDLARLFFTEMAEKDSNSIYNYLPDMISNLSSDTSISPADFQYIMTFIFGFIKKEKQVENLVEKLCARFRVSTNTRQNSDIAYCLSLMSFTSAGPVKKLIECLPYYYDKIYDEVVFGFFADILGKIKRNSSGTTANKLLATQEMKGILESYEMKLISIHQQATDSHDLVDNIKALRKPVHSNQGKDMKKTIKGIRKMKIAENDSELDDMVVDDENEPSGLYRPRANENDVPDNIHKAPLRSSRRLRSNNDN